MNEQLTNTEGGVVILSHSEFNNVVYGFKKDGLGEFKSYLSSQFSTGITMQIMKLPPGDYRLSEISVDGESFSGLGYNIYFHVEAGQLNYFGDLYMSRAFFKDKLERGAVNFACIDKQDELESYLRRKFPLVLAQNKIEYTRVAKR